MNPSTGREFEFTNPQDDPELYPKLPTGFRYDLDGHVQAMPNFNLPSRRQLRAITVMPIRNDNPFAQTTPFKPPSSDAQ